MKIVALVLASTALAVVVIVAVRLERKIMAVNEALTEVRDNLVEASTEIVARITALEGQVASGETVDPALLAEIKNLAQGLADVVPDEEPEPEVPGEQLPGDETEAPVEEVEGEQLPGDETEVPVEEEPPVEE